MIRETPLSERPRERCLTQGPQCLSLRECLALILNSGPPGKGALGLAQDILGRPGQGLPQDEEERAFFNSLEVSPLAPLKDLRGLGPAAQARVLAAFELGRRYALYRTQNSNTPTPIRLLTPDVAITKIPQELRSSPQEWLGFVPRYSDNKLGELCIVDRGSRTHVNTDPVELFARILALRPKAFYLFHNHPSGILHPSDQDHALTESVDDLARRLGIRLLGHAVITATHHTWIPRLKTSVI